MIVEFGDQEHIEHTRKQATSILPHKTVKSKHDTIIFSAYHIWHFCDIVDYLTSSTAIIIIMMLLLGAYVIISNFSTRALVF